MRSFGFRQVETRADCQLLVIRLIHIAILQGAMGISKMYDCREQYRWQEVLNKFEDPTRIKLPTCAVRVPLRLRAMFDRITDVEWMLFEGVFVFVLF